MANEIQAQPVNDRAESRESVSRADSSPVNLTSSDANHSVKEMEKSKGSNDISWNNLTITDSSAKQKNTGNDSTIARASGNDALGSGPSASGLKSTNLSDSVGSKAAAAGGSHKDSGRPDTITIPRMEPYPMNPDRMVSPMPSSVDEFSKSTKEDGKQKGDKQQPDKVKPNQDGLHGTGRDTGSNNPGHGQMPTVSSHGIARGFGALRHNRRR